MEQAGDTNGDSALQLGAPGESLGSGPFLRIVKSGVFGITSRTLNGGLEFIRNARLSWRSLWTPKPARTAQLPVPVGSQASPTRGCKSAFALFSVRQEDPTKGSVSDTPALSNKRLAHRPFTSCQPFVISSLNPKRNVRFDFSFISSWTYQAPSHCR